MSFCERTKVNVRFELGLSEEFSVKIGEDQGSVLSLLLFEMMVYEVTENVRKGWIKQIVFAADLVFMEETMKAEAVPARNDLGRQKSI